MDEDEPIRELTFDEYAQLRSQIEGTLPLAPLGESTTILGRRIWKMALAGKNRDQIARKLNIDLPVLDEALKAFSMRLGTSVDHYRLLDNDRLERLIGYWLPVATGGPLTIEKIRAGEAFTESDVEHPLQASEFILRAIAQRVKIFAAAGILTDLPGGDPDRPYNERQIVIWLKEVLPSIERITRELELPHANGTDPNGTGDQRAPKQTDSSGNEDQFNNGGSAGHQ